MRHLLEHESPVVAFLFHLAGITVDLDALEVRPMSDGDMGSLAIAPFDSSRKLGSSPAECHFYDLGGVPVSVALNLDQDGRPFEIDIWRVDFAPTVKAAYPCAIYAIGMAYTLRPLPSCSNFCFIQVGLSNFLG